MGAGREYRTLQDALLGSGIPEGNHDFIRKIEGHIEFAGFVQTSGYLRADRADGGPSLHIASGWTNGFVTKQEVLDIFGPVHSWGDDERARRWGVAHPENSIGQGGGGGRPERPDEVCPVHFMVLPASGVCGLCD